MALARPDERIGQMEGAAALPRANGELVFEAPWQGRIFGLAVALNDRRMYDWDEFRACLVDEIGAASEMPYYEAWLAAFEKLLLARGVVTPAELELRMAEYASGERTDEDHEHDDDHHAHDDDPDHGSVRRAV